MPILDGPPAWRPEQRSRRIKTIPAEERQTVVATTGHVPSGVLATKAEDKDRRKGRRPIGSDLSSAPRRLCLRGGLANCKSILRSLESHNRSSGLEDWRSGGGGREEDRTLEMFIIRSSDENVRQRLPFALLEIEMEADSGPVPVARAKKLGGSPPCGH